MNFNIIENVPDTAYLDAELLENGLPKAVPARFLLDLPPFQLQVWCHRHAIYQYPTVELIEWLNQRIAGRSVLEICAGKSCLGRFIGARMCDNYCQTWPGIKQYYDLMQTPTISHQPDVEVLDAVEAVYLYKPEVVVGAWVTQRFVEGDVDANMFGPDEALIIAKAEYIHVGNLGPHRTKRIFKSKHEELSFDWLCTRAMKPENNRIWIWERQKFSYPKPDKPFLVGRPSGANKCAWCPCAADLTEEHLAIAREHGYPILCVGCATAKYGPDLVLSMLGD